VDPWSVLKVSVLFYLTMSCVALVAGTVLWLGATATGVRGNIETFVADLIVSKDFHLSGPNLLRLAAICSACLVVVGSGANLLMVTLYNLISDLIGGVTVVVGPVSRTDATRPAEVRDGARESDVTARNGRLGTRPGRPARDPTGTQSSS
jgi:hypothetical protein